MPDTAGTRRIYLLGNPDKPAAAAELEDLQSFASSRCLVVGFGLGLDVGPAIDAHADRIVVFGGDGTLIGVTRSLGADQIPLIGVNLGKLGFLTEFSSAELKMDFERVILDESLVSRRTLLQVTVRRNGEAGDTSLAVNDCVIQAGPPFRMINLGVSINGQQLTTVRGDGLIVCTPSGSTAHNLSAGGPLMEPGVEAIVLTPLCPHSLTHRPLVVEREAVFEILMHDVNEGTTAIIDGQVSYPLKPGDKVTVKRYHSDFRLVRNPRYARWHNLVTKLHWGQAPSFQ